MQGILYSGKYNIDTPSLGYQLSRALLQACSLSEEPLWLQQTLHCF